MRSESIGKMITDDQMIASFKKICGTSQFWKHMMLDIPICIQSS